MKNFFWTGALLLSLVFLAAAYYIRVPTVRTAIDARAPWVNGFLGQFVEDSPVAVAPRPVPIEEPLAAPERAEPTSPPKEKTAPPEIFDLRKLAADRAAWPVAVTLARATDFPAVVDGKVVGSVTAPKGAEVKLVTISGGKLGVDYQGGGAWLFVEETDLMARVQHK